MTIRRYVTGGVIMFEALERLVLQCFVQDERNQVELRLNLEEVEFLRKEYGAVCSPMPVNHSTSIDGKLWYMVEIDM